MTLRQSAGVNSPVRDSIMSSSSAAAGRSSSTMMIVPPFYRAFDNPLMVRWAEVPCIADSLHPIPSTIIHHGKEAAIGVIALWILLCSLWFPFWILSFLLSEVGVYITLIASIFTLGRAAVRLIALPGSSHRVYGEIEREFARYSVRMLDSAIATLVDLATALLASSSPPTVPAASPSSSSSRNDHILSLWKRASSYRDRVLGMYYDILSCLIHHNGDATLISTTSSPHPQQQQQQQDPILTRYKNNRLMGDIGKLHNLTPKAHNDGRAFLSLLSRLLSDFDHMEQETSSLIHHNNTNTLLSPEARSATETLLRTATELRDMLPSLKPPPSSSSSSSSQNHSDDNERLRQQQPTLHLVKNTFSSLLPMLDPPPHSSIFGLDVLRATMLSRYKASRQYWIPRPQGEGGSIDLIHIPSHKRLSQSHSHSTLPPPNKAVLYCNPNAGLFEVATGMSLIGGNIVANDIQPGNETCWTDFYLENDFDVFLFNYAGFGRSYGGWNNNNNTTTYSYNLFSRLWRIFMSTFLTFKPSTETMKADATTVAHFISTNIRVQRLVIHGESIGGLAAAHAARALSTTTTTTTGTSNTTTTTTVVPALLFCDRSFCNLEAVAQRLVAPWTGFAIRSLTPLWSTDVAGDFLAARCPKLLANDAKNDAIISDTASLKTGLALACELNMGYTKGIAWMTQILPLEYRMAENVTTTTTTTARSSHFDDDVVVVRPPIWPTDKRISRREAIHFAACVRRIGLLASNQRKSSLRERIVERDEETGIIMEDHSLQRDISLSSSSSSSSSSLFSNNGKSNVSNHNHIIEAWTILSLCNGLCGVSLGSATHHGYDNIISWLCSALVYGGQRVTKAAIQRIGNSNKEEEVNILPQDFDLKPLNNNNNNNSNSNNEDENEEEESMISIPEVLIQLQSFNNNHHNNHHHNQNKNNQSIQIELQYCISILEYIIKRLSSSKKIYIMMKSFNQIKFYNNDENDDNNDCGIFMPLICGHNSQYSYKEREELKSILNQL